MAIPSDSNVPTATMTGFFKLPPELRLAIYGFAITKPDCMNIRKSQVKFNGSIILPAMMRVSRTMREDASELCQKHLLDARSALYARTNVAQARLQVFEGHWSRWTMDVSRLSIKEHRQHIKDGREWMARIDEVVAKLDPLI
ncbi:hypothetical protein LTR17_010284 [Elasticomyces elasticus]|nr:hypothetical protein LTR17_010284 [Elasticomyces elasticus]